MNKILEIAKQFKIDKYLSFYGRDIAKVDTKALCNSSLKGKLVLVTAMTSNASGIGKTTVSIGLADALNMLNKKTMLALREPSLGPVFGIKGGATGGGKSSLVPSDEINLHFTGDFHAITSANNLLCSIIDNHIFHGNELNIDPTKIFFKRCLDVNDRSLREIEYTIKNQKIKSGFNITAASELMAIMCLSRNLADLKQNIGNILVALNKNDKPIYARNLQAEESMCALLKNALKPNFVRTLGNSPALVHLGPFANIAHGCNSIIATEFALKTADICVTEAGFGSDLGAEKFLDIKCRKLNKTPNATVLVVTISTIKEHGNGNLVNGFENVKKHINNLTQIYNLPTVVAINQHKLDSKSEIDLIKKLCNENGVDAVTVNAFTHGGKGSIELAQKVIELVNKKTEFKFCYKITDSIETKINKIATKIYGAINVTYSPVAKEKLKLIKKLNCEDYFVNIAKTQFSFSDNKNLLGSPSNFTLTINDIEIRSGAKMIVPIAGNMLLMPGLAKKSNYLNIKLNGDKIENLF